MEGLYVVYLNWFPSHLCTWIDVQNHWDGTSYERMLDDFDNHKMMILIFFCMEENDTKIPSDNAVFLSFFRKSRILLPE